MHVAAAISRALVSEGITLAAGIAGQQIGRLLDAIADCGEISLMYARQERVAFDIADGFARSSGRPAIVFTDSGPAAANLMGALVNSWGDSVPVLFFCGHNNRTETSSRGTKEIPLKELFSPVAKWTALLSDPAQTAETLRRAFMHLRTGRPGPVVIGLCYDVLAMDLGNFEYAPVNARPRARSGADPEAITAALELLAGAKQPYVYTGSGILFSEATDDLVRLAELLTLPVATTLNGKSGFPEDHPLALGIGGFGRASYSSLGAALTAEKADVMMTIGCGFRRHATIQRPGPRVKHIQIEVDPAELNRDHLADVALLGDARVVLRQLVEAAQKLPKSRLAPVKKRLQEVAELRARWDDVCRPLLESEEAPVNPFRVTRELNELVDPRHTIVLHDAGSVRGTTCQHFIASHPRSFLGFGVQSAMGWTVGAAMGAKKANPDKLVVTFTGEEAFNETAMDVETSIRNEAPVLYIIKNNRQFADRDGGASARLAHARFHQGVDVVQLAKALGANAYRVYKPGELNRTLKRAIADVQGGRTTVVEVLTSRVAGSLHRLWDPAAAGKRDAP